MKGKALKSFAGLLGGAPFAYRQGQEIEIEDWSWVTGGLVAPMAAPVAAETSTVQPAERAVSKRGRHEKNQAEDCDSAGI